MSRPERVGMALLVVFWLGVLADVCYGRLLP